MRILAGRIKRVMIARGIIRADCGARLDGVGNEPVVDEIHLRHMACSGEGIIDCRLVAERPLENRVVRGGVVHLRRSGLLRRRRIDRCLQLVISDQHELGGRFRLLLCLGNHEGDMIADITHLPLRQRRVRPHLHRAAVLRMNHPAADQPADLVCRQILARVHAEHARCGARL